VEDLRRSRDAGILSPLAVLYDGRSARVSTDRESNSREGGESIHEADVYDDTDSPGSVVARHPITEVLWVYLLWASDGDTTEQQEGNQDTSRLEGTVFTRA
jgi:hypothetical protein